jgi:hypothetical protein
MYKFGHSSNDRDEVRCKKGTYRLLLHPDLRDKFHENLHSALYDLTDSNKNPLHNPPDKSHTKKSIKIPREISDQDSKIVYIIFKKYLRNLLALLSTDFEISISYKIILRKYLRFIIHIITLH